VDVVVDASSLCVTVVREVRKGLDEVEDGSTVGLSVGLMGADVTLGVGAAVIGASVVGCRLGSAVAGDFVGGGTVGMPVGMRGQGRLWQGTLS